MRKALFILGQLSDVDVEWIAHNGERRRLSDGEVIVREGVPLDARRKPREASRGRKIL